MNTLKIGRDLSVLLLISSSSIALAFQPTVVSIKAEGDGTYTYRYRIKIDALVQLQCGKTSPDPDFFTIFNFDGMVAGSQEQPPGWTFSSSTFGVTPLRGERASLSPVDTPGIPNLTWSCSGPNIRGPATVEGFAIRTKVKDTMVGEYGTQQTRLEAGTIHAGKALELKEASIGSVTVPSLKVRQ